MKGQLILKCEACCWKNIVCMNILTDNHSQGKSWEICCLNCKQTVIIPAVVSETRFFENMKFKKSKNIIIQIKSVILHLNTSPNKKRLIDIII